MNHMATIKLLQMCAFTCIQSLYGVTFENNELRKGKEKKQYNNRNEGEQVEKKIKARADAQYIRTNKC